MSSSHRVSPYGSTKQGSRWDRQSKDSGNEAGFKRKLPSSEDTSRQPTDEPDVKKTLNSQKINISPKISLNLEDGDNSQTNSLVSSKAPAPVKLSLGANKPKEVAPALPKPKAMTVAAAFASDESSDDEEMPPEAKMRMRNLGKDTPTAAGPNSFGKNRLGFCDRQKVIQRELQKKMDEISKKTE